MKKNITISSLVMLWVSIFTAPLASATTIIPPALEAFQRSWTIVSLFGPRYWPSSKFHGGIDFSPVPGNGDLGYMIQSRSDGVITEFKRSTVGGGWALYVQPPAAIRASHGVEDLHYMHLFQWDGTVPSIQSTTNGYTEVEVVTVQGTKIVNKKSITKTCDGIAFWTGDTVLILSKVLTKQKCDGIPYLGVPATSKVEVGDEIAPIGISNYVNSNVDAHLHLGMNIGAKDNPFYVVKRLSAEPTDSFFSAKLWTDKFDLAQIPDYPGFWVHVDSGTELSLDKVDLWVMKNGQKQLVQQFSFGGRPKESKIHTDVKYIELLSNDKKCTLAPPALGFLVPMNQACDWAGESEARRWRFFAPYTKSEFESLTPGTNTLCIGMTSINGYYTEECKPFTVNGGPFSFDVVEADPPLINRLVCTHYDNREFAVSGYFATYDWCTSGGIDARIRCSGSGCDGGRFKVAIVQSNRTTSCSGVQENFGIDPIAAATYDPSSPFWVDLGSSTKAWPSVSEISPLANGNGIFGTFQWIGDAPIGDFCFDYRASLSLVYNVYDSVENKYYKIPFEIVVP